MERWVQRLQPCRLHALCAPDAHLWGALPLEASPSHPVLCGQAGGSANNRASWHQAHAAALTVG